MASQPASHHHGHEQGGTVMIQGHKIGERVEGKDGQPDLLITMDRSKVQCCGSGRLLTGSGSLIKKKNNFK